MGGRTPEQRALNNLNACPLVRELVLSDVSAVLPQNHSLMPDACDTRLSITHRCISRLRQAQLGRGQRLSSCLSIRDAVDFIQQPARSAVK